MNTFRSLCFLFLVLRTSGKKSCTKTDSLHECIFAKYNKNMRPGRVSQQITQLDLKLNLVSIDYVNLKHRTVKAEIYIDLEWKDERLRWNASDVDNLTWLTADPKKLWTPDLMLSSIGESIVFLSFDNTLARIHQDGTVNIYPYFHIKLRTDVDVTEYPFDTQKVSFVFETWSYSIEHLMFSIDDDFNPIGSLVPSGEWETVGYGSLNFTKKYPSGHYHKAGYTVTLKRRSLYYILNILGPVFVVSLLNILCFILPVSSSDRVTLCISIFITLALFLTSVSDSLPKTSEGVSVCIIFIGLQMIGSAFTTVMIVLIIAIDSCGTDSVTLSAACPGKACCRCSDQNTEGDRQLSIQEDERERNDCNGDKVSTKGNGRYLGKPKMGRKRLSAQINSVCLFLSVIWNIALFTTILIHSHM